MANNELLKHIMARMLAEIDWFFRSPDIDGQAKAVFLSGITDVVKDVRQDYIDSN